MAGRREPGRRGSAGERKLAVVADEVGGRRFETVDHAAHAREARAGQHLLDGALGEVADHLRLGVVLAAENALPAWIDVQVLERARADVVAAAERPAASGDAHPDVEVAGPVV